MIKITVDSGADISAKYAKENNINVIAMHVIMDNVTLDDGMFPVQEVFDYYERTKKISTTSAVNPFEYVEAFNRINKLNPNGVILHISYSSRVSSSYQNCMIAKADYDNVYVVDSLNVSGGYGLVVDKAVELVNKYDESQIDVVIKELEAFVQRVHMVFMPTTLDYLLAGGRLSNAAYVAANLLQIKPLICLEDGYLVGRKKYRGKIDRLIDKVWSDFMEDGNHCKDRIVLLYSLHFDEKNIDLLKEKALDAGFKKIIVAQTGCVISNHGGPGAFGFAAERAL